MKRTIIEKIWEVHGISADAGAQAPEILTIDLMLMHEVTSAQAFKLLKERNIPLFDRSRLVATLDHSIPTRKNRFEIFDDSARIQVETLRAFCKEFDIQLFDFDSGYQGIVHVIGPELGLSQPGMTIVCGDSHTSTHGAFGALAFGVGTSEVGHVMATGSILQRRSKTMKVSFEGAFKPGVSAKDAILKLIAEIGISGANGHVIEYCGSVIAAMSMEERMTMCNVICEVHDLAAFEAQLVSLYGMKAGFEIRASDVSPPALVARFYHGDWEYEVFGQDVRIERQNAYRHLVQTHRVLVVGGEEWRKAIRMLKQQGIKTEPAVAQCLRLSGDPYQAVLSLELLSDEQLVRLIEKGLAHSVMQVQ